MAVAGVGELAVVGLRALLKALDGESGEVSGEGCVLHQNGCASGNKRVDQRRHRGAGGANGTCTATPARVNTHAHKTNVTCQPHREDTDFNCDLNSE